MNCMLRRSDPPAPWPDCLRGGPPFFISHVRAIRSRVWADWPWMPAVYGCVPCHQLGGPYMCSAADRLPVNSRLDNAIRTAEATMNTYARNSIAWQTGWGSELKKKNAIPMRVPCHGERRNVSASGATAPIKASPQALRVKADVPPMSSGRAKGNQTRKPTAAHIRPPPISSGRKPGTK